MSDLLLCIYSINLISYLIVFFYLPNIFYISFSVIIIYILQMNLYSYILFSHFWFLIFYRLLPFESQDKCKQIFLFLFISIPALLFFQSIILNIKQIHVLSLNCDNKVTGRVQLISRSWIKKSNWKLNYWIYLTQFFRFDIRQQMTKLLRAWQVLLFIKFLYYRLWNILKDILFWFIKNSFNNYLKNRHYFQ